MAGHRLMIINNQREARLALEEIGVDPGAYPYLMPKASQRLIKLKDIPCRAANIIKQEMLSKGGEAAVRKEAISFEGSTDVLLMGSLKHYRLLLPKLRIQPFGLKKLAVEIETILENSDIDSWTVPLPGGKSLKVDERTLIMGILNVTPDSFSDGGRYLEPDAAVERALKMVDEGADIVDVGGASSRPDSRMASADEELERIMPVVTRLVKENIIISIDTFRASVARECLEAGVHIINDIGALRLDNELLPVLVEHQAPVVLMHNRMQIDQGRPYSDLMSDIVDELGEAIEHAVKAGLGKELILIDPGLGFGKNPSQNRFIVKHLPELKGLGCPIVLGASRKRFIGATLNLEVDERLEGSLAVAVMGAMNGANIVRVHDVKESKRVLTMTDAVMRENG